MEFLSALGAMSLFAWLFVFFVFGLCILFSEWERPDFALVTFIILGISFWYFGIINLITLAWNNLELVIAYSVLYLIVGVCWSFFKWNQYAAICRKQYNAALEQYSISLARYEARDKKEQWTKPDTIELKYYRPNTLENKNKFFTWIIMWWASMFWYVFSDLIMDLVEFILRYFGKVYDRITDRHFGKLP